VSPKYILEMAKTVEVDAVAPGPAGLGGTAPAPVPVAGTAQHGAVQVVLWAGLLPESQPAAAASAKTSGRLRDRACPRPFTTVLGLPAGALHSPCRTRISLRSSARVVVLPPPLSSMPR
jgi:hypothetical protein